MSEGGVYIVKKGDSSLTQIARDHSLSLEQLLQINPDVNPDAYIHEGDQLNVPFQNFTYSVRSGDVGLSQIAKDRGVTLTAIKSANPDMPNYNVIHRGQEIVIPTQHYIYTVQPGDNLTSIAKTLGGDYLTVQALYDANPEISAGGNINPDDKIRIPTGYMSHEVQAGQWFNRIAGIYNLSSGEVHDANPQLRGRTNVNKGRFLNIPGPLLLEKFSEAMEAAEPIEARRLVQTEEPPQANFPAAFNIPAEEVQKAWERAVRKSVHKPVNARPDDAPLIVIDLGHRSRNLDGELDPGSISRDGKLREIDVVDRVGFSLAEQLRLSGYRVAFTRNPGEELAYQGPREQKNGRQSVLNVRTLHGVNLERELKAPYTVMVSLHADSAKGTSGSGYGLIVPKVSYKNPDLTRHSRELARFLQPAMGVFHEQRFRGINNYRGLAIMREFAKHAYGSDAGVLIELGFLNNPTSQAVLEEFEEEPYKIAAGIARGIRNYISQESPGYTPIPPSPGSNGVPAP